jgi:uncharacterized protein
MSLPGVIDGLQFARGALEKRGSLGMEHLPRLAQMQCSTPGLDYRIRGGTAGHGKLSLRISVTGRLQLACHICLGPLSVPIAVDIELQLAGSEREINEADDDVDRVLASRTMDVAGLVEDEAILALPMVPRHDACAAAGSAARAKESPFSAPLLALQQALKRGDDRH